MPHDHVAAVAKRQTLSPRMLGFVAAAVVSMGGIVVALTYKHGTPAQRDCFAMAPAFVLLQSRVSPAIERLADDYGACVGDIAGGASRRVGCRAAAVTVAQGQQANLGELERVINAIDQRSEACLVP